METIQHVYFDSGILKVYLEQKLMAKGHISRPFSWWPSLGLGTTSTLRRTGFQKTNNPVEPGGWWQTAAAGPHSAADADIAPIFFNTTEKCLDVSFLRAFKKTFHNLGGKVLKIFRHSKLHSLERSECRCALFVLLGVIKLSHQRKFWIAIALSTLRIDWAQEFLSTKPFKFRSKQSRGEQNRWGPRFYWIVRSF